VRVELRRADGQTLTRDVAFGDLLLMPLPREGEVTMTATPERHFDLGEGKGRPITQKVRGGVVGLIVDARGRRPFELPADPAFRIERLRAWNQALGAYPEGV
jgi:hypothetical protein